MLKQLEVMTVPKARIFLQDTIDQYSLYASILYKGNQVWSRKRIIQNLKRIFERGQLYKNKDKRVRWMRVSPNICLPAVPQEFKPILSEYFYNFLTMCCGSQMHYSRAGWIGIYPTLDDFKRFFLKNEHGKPVSEYIPDWKADARRIVEDIERMLYPFRSYIKARQKEESQRGTRY